MRAAWGALALTLTLLGGLYTWVAYQRRGLAAGLRGAALITLLPVAAWLTDVLELLARDRRRGRRLGADVSCSARRCGSDRASPASRSSCSWCPGSWPTAVSAPSRVSRARRTRSSSRPPSPAPSSPVVADPVAGGVDAEMAEIEAILRKRGIT